MSRLVGSGRCAVCGHVGEFKLTGPRDRASHRCQRCNANLRYRAQAKAIATTIGDPDASLSDLVAAGRFEAMAIYEPGVMGPFRKLFRAVPNYVTSGYWPDVPPGGERDGVRCEDLHRLSFSDDSFDLVVSSDIFEHVRRPQQAFAEIYRVLRPGAWHVFTVPTGWPPTQLTRSRIDTSTDEDVHLLPVRYHNSPTDPNGALVYTNFELDLPDQLAELGFETVTHHGYRNALTFASRKPAAADR